MQAKSDPAMCRSCLFGSFLFCSGRDRRLPEAEGPSRIPPPARLGLPLPLPHRHLPRQPQLHTPPLGFSLEPRKRRCSAPSTQSRQAVQTTFQRQQPLPHPQVSFCPHHLSWVSTRPFSPGDFLRFNYLFIFRLLPLEN